MTGATCKSCDAPIVWGVTKAGKKVPLDPPEKRYVARPRAVFDTQLGVEIVETWTPHFATCPNANQHRRTS